MKRMTAKLAAWTAIATMAAGCYIGRANFEGENMHLYTPWNMMSTAASADVE
jgi:hypothetical protein